MKYITCRKKQYVFILFIAVFGIVATVPAESNQSAGNTEKHKVVGRDPFWPIGHVPVNGVKQEEEKQEEERPRGDLSWSDAMKQVTINGVSRRDNEFFAIVNGQVKRVGDTITINHKGISYTWAVDGIKPPGSVKLRRVSAL